jgi:hypothetical protein
MILLYAFSNQWATNISRRTLLELQKLLNQNTIIPPLVKEGVGGDFVFQIIRFHPKDFFQKYIRNNKYDLIIGLGDYYGNISKIKIETSARNAYDNRSIYEFAPINLELSLPSLDLVDPQNFIISENMGTYNCNYIAFEIQRWINDHSPHTKQLFFHLPKSQNASLLAGNLLDLFKNNNLLS